MKPQKIIGIIDAIQHILDHVHKDEKERAHLIAQVSVEYKKSAANLINYLSLRSFDIRDLQRKLGFLGMSRLARAEAHVEATLKTTLYLLHQFLNNGAKPPSKYNISIKSSEKMLIRHTKNLLGEAPKNRRLRIMVTMPAKAADDYKLVENIIQNGMNCARINCAHDGSKRWLKMIKNIKLAGEKLNKKVAISMDLGGPKIRTGEIECGPQVKYFLPERNVHGNVIHPAIIGLVSDEKKLTDTDIPVDGQWSSQLSVNDKITFIDTRGKNRELKVVKTTKKRVLTHSQDSAYIESGTLLKSNHGESIIGDLPSTPQSIYLKNGDELMLHKNSVKGQPAQFDKKGELLKAAFISCTLPEALNNVAEGDPIYFDDGKIKGEVSSKQKNALLVKITEVKSGGTKLNADKGINFPESELQISGLTEKDKEDLKFIAKHADIVNFSFVNSRKDVKELFSELEKLNAKDKLGIILKIETQHAYDNLSKIMLEAMKGENIGVMIARGDLAIEAGWKKIGSIQREMLAICNASHVPVVWATQVLENLAKKGLPSRSEITDAVNATKADCVMLNKGPHILSAIKLLDKIIVSSEAYQDKNAPMLPKLKKISRREEAVPA